MMQPYSIKPVSYLNFEGKQIASFITPDEKNIDHETIKAFGIEWNRFNNFNDQEIQIAGSEYFDIVNNEMLNKTKTVLDLGCGSGRWSKFIADRAAFIEAVDPSDAVYSAAGITRDNSNIRITQAGVDNIPFADESFDFVFSHGVMHHLPDTQSAINKTVNKIKTNGYFLIYLYYNLDNRSVFFRFLFMLSNVIRLIISRFPPWLKIIVCDIFAAIIYMPFVFLGRIIKAAFPSRKWYLRVPLSYYINKSFTIIRNDALDRFGTPLEKRFSKHEIEEMLRKAGLKNIIFSNHPPYWHAIAQK